MLRWLPDQAAASAETPGRDAAWALYSWAEVSAWLARRYPATATAVTSYDREIAAADHLIRARHILPAPADRLTRVVAVFGLNSVLGLLASVASGAVAALTFGWLLPMTAVRALALATAVAARSASVGAGAGVAAWVIAALAGQTASGQLTASVTNARAYLPYLAVAACCAAVVIYGVRPEGGP